ncbi:MAG: response regulator [Desulfobulbus propionicus]|nr:MAG: response regulator [Desulfobulbus propionicus]
MRILVIDDDEQMRLLLRQIIEWTGYEVLEAVDGLDGMVKQHQYKADLVITDIIMPEQEGLETITALKKEYPGLKIIAISGGGRIGPEAYLPAAKELGADRVFSKPFDVKELAEAVKELLKNE